MCLLMRAWMDGWLDGWDQPIPGSAAAEPAIPRRRAERGFGAGPDKLKSFCDLGFGPQGL